MRKTKLWLNTKLLWKIIHNSEDSMWYYQKGYTLSKIIRTNNYITNNWSNSHDFSWVIQLIQNQWESYDWVHSISEVLLIFIIVNFILYCEFS